MNKSDVISTVRKQLAIDLNCSESDFDKGCITITEAKQNPGRLMYRDGERAMNACCFGGSAVFSVKEEMVADFKRVLEGQAPEWIFKPMNIVRFNELLYLHGYNLGNMLQYFAPDPTLPKTEPCCEVEWIDPSDFEKFRNDALAKEALGFDENAPDMLCVAAKENGKIIGMAGASADSNLMWQIGVGVSPEHRGKGIAANLVSLLKDAVLEKGIIPYYGTAVSHTLSLSTGVSAGFFPAWTRIISTDRTDEFLHMHDGQ